MANLFHLIVPIVVITTTSRINPHAGLYNGGYSCKSACQYYCTDPGKFCARGSKFPYKYFCTDGSTEECDVRRYRDYYFKVEKVDWDYLPSGTNKVDDNNEYLLDSLINKNNRVGCIYSKYIYKRYTDKDYTTELPSNPSHGFVGPTIYGEIGDVVRVHITNCVQHDISIHPHGVGYTKINEGAFYVDGTSGKNKKDDRIPFGATRTLQWHMTEDFAPRDDDPNCLPMAYHSHNLPAAEINSGLIGLIIVCKPGTLSDTGRRLDVDREHVLYFDSIDEGHSLLLAENIQRCLNSTECQSLLDSGDEAFVESLKKDSINGYMYANGPPFEVCTGERVAWYIFSLEAELHAVEIHGHTWEQKHTRTNAMALFPATFLTAQTVSTREGFWLISCRNAEHNRNGMNAYLNVSSCGASPIVEPVTGATRTYYLRAESESWNYGPSGQNLYDGGSLTAPGSASEARFLSDATHIGGTYTKGRFVEYEDGNFVTAKTRGDREEHLALLGPVLQAEVEDTIVVVLQNSLSFNISLYLQGVSFDKSQDGLWEKGENGVLGGKIVAPGATVTYTYTVPWSVNLGQDDPLCRAFLYYSDINSEIDQNTGLLGPTLICKKGGLDPLTGRQKYVDREMFLLFADMDENLSRYIDDNIGAKTVDKTDPDFIESNVMRSINGRCYGNLEGLNMCKGESVAWHVLSSGGNEGLHGAVFNGNNLLINGINRDSHLTVPEVSFYGLMIADNVGNWSVACGNNDHFDKGEKAIYTVDLCGADPEPLYNISAVTRTYFIAAVEDDWDYTPFHTIHPITGENYSDPSSSQYNRVRKEGVLLGSKYKKALYKQFTDATFNTEIPKELYLGVLGPMIHVAVGDIVKVVFKNMATRNYSIHPQGLRYAKEYEGYLYQDDDTSTGDAIAPGTTYTYYWEVDESSGPTVTGPNCQGSIYHSAVNPAKDSMSGLIGPLAICKAGILDSDNTRHDYVSREYPLLMIAFDENESWYLQDNIDTNAPGTNTTTDEFHESNLYDCVNGYIYNNLPGLIMNCGEWTAWYVMAVGSNEDLHQLHFHGQMFIYRTTREHTGDVIEVVPHTVETVEMFGTNEGTWLGHCHFGIHTIDGMVITFTVIC